jgi:hypothetical protein
MAYLRPCHQRRGCSLLGAKNFRRHPSVPLEAWYRIQFRLASAICTHELRWVRGRRARRSVILGYWRRAGELNDREFASFVRPPRWLGAAGT